MFSLADFALKLTNFRLRKIGSRFIFSGLLALNHLGRFWQIEGGDVTNQFVVYSMRNPVINRNAKKVVFTVLLGYLS